MLFPLFRIDCGLALFRSEISAILCASAGSVRNTLPDVRKSRIVASSGTANSFSARVQLWNAETAFRTTTAARRGAWSRTSLPVTSLESLDPRRRRRMAGLPCTITIVSMLAVAAAGAAWLLALLVLLIRLGLVLLLPLPVRKLVSGVCGSCARTVTADAPEASRAMIALC